VSIVLTDEWHKQGLARAVPGSYWDGEERAWVLDDPTPRSAAVALKLFPDLNHRAPELVELRGEMLSDLRPFDNATPYNSRIERAARAGRARRPRLVAVRLPVARPRLPGRRAAQHKGAYVGWERGMGKTLGTCCLIDNLDAEKTLIVCPNTAKQTVWGDELKRFCPWLEVLVLPNSKPKRLAMLTYAQQLALEQVPFVLVTHYESLAIVAGKQGKRLADGWKKLGIAWDLFVADEGHRFANPDALMTKAAKKIPATYRVMLSGSIIQNHLEELYGPLSILFPDRYKSKWRDWNDRYLDYVENGYARVCVGVKPERIPQLREELGVFMVYRRKEDELDLPTRTDQTLYVDLTPAQTKAYREVVEECMTTLADDTKIKAAEGIAMLTKLRQIATGLDLLGDVADSAKLDLAVEMIADDEDGDFVVFGWYKSSLHALADRLRAKGIEPFVVTGDVKHEDRSEMIARFQAGEGRVFLGTLSTLSESVNLQRANNAIFLDRSWNPGQNVQAEDRIYRTGQTRKVTITHLVARGTVDELKVLPTLANKEALRAAILGG
jgi:SNF2 family DNA or RNA helicase